MRFGSLVKAAGIVLAAYLRIIGSLILSASLVVSTVEAQSLGLGLGVTDRSVFRASGFFPAGFRFDGSTTYMLRGAALSGVADSATGLFSGWYKIRGGDGAAERIFNTPGGQFRISRLASNKLEIQLADSGFANGINVVSTTSYTTSSTWLHIAMDWNTAFASGSRVVHLYVNGVNDKNATPTSDFGSSFNVNYNQANFAFGADVGGTNPLFADAAEVYLALGQTLDLSVTANLRKFISATGNPVALGPTCALPTGSQPIICFNKTPYSTTSFASNDGTGGNFAITGGITVVGGPPF